MGNVIVSTTNSDCPNWEQSVNGTHTDAFETIKFSRLL